LNSEGFCEFLSILVISLFFNLISAFVQVAYLVTDGYECGNNFGRMILNEIQRSHPYDMLLFSAYDREHRDILSWKVYGKMGFNKRTIPTDQSEVLPCFNDAVLMRRTRTRKQDSTAKIHATFSHPRPFQRYNMNDDQEGEIKIEDLSLNSENEDDETDRDETL